MPSISLPFAVFAGLLLATGAMRLVELVVSVRRFRARPDALIGEPRLFPAMALLHAGLVFGPIAEVWWLERPFVPALAVGSVVLLVAATALRIWTLSTIGRAWNVRVVKPQEGAIATGGPYRWIRHPNYLCVILELLALPMLHTAWISALALTLLNGAVLVVRIRTEEAMLMQIDAWREAFASRARLIPGVF